MWNTSTIHQITQHRLLLGKVIALLITILFTINIIGARAQGKWTRKGDYPSVIRTHPFAFSIGNKGYMGGGELTFYEYYKDFWEYDPATDVWTQKADFGGGGRTNAVGFTIGNKGYVGCGTPAFAEVTDEFWEYDPVENKWTRKADFAGGERGGPFGFGIGNKGYMGPGTSDDFWEYDPATDKWVRKANFGGGERVNAVGFSINGKGYVGTGYSDKGSFSDFWEYNPITNKWTRMADFPGGERAGAFGLNINDKGYVGLGNNNDDYKKDLWEYDPIMNQWERKADFGGSARREAGAFSVTGKGYVGTGVIGTDPSFVHLKDFWEYTPEAAPNKPPTVTLTTPFTKYSAPARIKLNAKATDEDSKITKVQFFKGTTRLHTETKSPYGYRWSNVPVGNYTLTAKAYDNSGKVTTSKAVKVSVVNYNVPPVVSILNPAKDTSYTWPATIRLTAKAKDPNDKISKVEFYRGTKLIRTERYYPYAFKWKNIPVGTYSITAKAYDDKGATATSAAVKVKLNIAPTVIITSPADKTTYTAPENITINALAADKDGSISNVKFYNGTTRLKTVSKSPYTYTLSDLQAGNYSFTAKATDNDGGLAISKSVTVTIKAQNQPPAVRIISPTNNSTYTAPATITINALAADEDGTISNVKLYKGTDYLTTISKSPYSYTLHDLTKGMYSFTAKARDNLGAETISKSVLIKVVSPKTSIVSSRPLSADNKTGITGLRLIPNPVNNVLQIYTNGLQSKPSTISVISVTGVVMKTIQSNASNKVVQLDVSSLVRGVYIIKVINGGKVAYKQFLKL